MASTKFYGDIEINKSIIMKEVFESPSNPDVGTHKMFIKDGKINVINSDGDSIEMGGSGDTIVKDVSNPLTTKPLEYGYFKITNETSISENTNIPFDSVVDGNMSTTSDGVVLLEQGKTYKVSCDIYMVSSSSKNTRLSLVNVDTNEELITSAKVPVSISGNYSGSTICGIITPQVDTKVAVRVNYALQNVYSAHSYLVIEEIRNNPVNQYGGFETEVLFDGEASVAGDYKLADDVSNYNFIQLNTIVNKETDGILPNMTSNTTPSPYVISASSYLTAGYEPYVAFNGVNNNYICWHSALQSDVSRDNPIWLQVDTGKNTYVDTISITSRNEASSNGQYPTHIVLKGSYDGNTWEDLYEESSLVWSQNETKYFSVGDVDYRYYRFCSIDLSNMNQAYVAVGSMNLHKSNSKKDIIKSIIIDSCLDVKNDDYWVEFNRDNMKIKDSKTFVSTVVGIKGQIPTILSGGKF